MYLENKRQRVYRVTSDDKRERESVAPYQRERKTFCVFARSRKISRSARREADPLFCRETWPAKTRRYPSFRLFIPLEFGLNFGNDRSSTRGNKSD